MTTNDRKHRLRLFQNPIGKSNVGFDELIARAERQYQWHIIAERVGYYSRDDKLDKLLWRRNKRRKEQRHCAEKRVKGNG